jgi:hypothetical protein
MRRALAIVTAYLAFAVFALLVVEGGYSIARWKHADRSITYDAFAALRRMTGGGPPKRAAAGFEIASRDDIEALLPEMVAEGVGMGNVPYKEVVTGKAAINAPLPNGCLEPKPNLAKTTTYIRSGDYDRFDPPSLFFDRDAELGPRLDAFIKTFAVHLSRFTSNADSERLTLPEVKSPRKFLVAGDSVAVGSMIDDSETIASQLQRRRADVQFVNLGINGADAKDIVCRLTKAGTRYGGSIAGLIYVYCENDFKPGEPYGKPEEVIAWLQAFAASEKIADVTVVFAPYIYNIMPQLTRFDGSRGEIHGRFAEEAARLRQLTTAAGFRYISIADVAREEAEAKGTDFAAFALFVDHAHLSNYGVSRLVEKLASP